MWQRTCGVVIALGQRRERLGRIVARLHFEPRPVDRRPVEPRRRAGLQPAEREAGLLERVAPARPTALSPTRPAGVRCSPRWITPRRKVPVVDDHAPRRRARGRRRVRAPRIAPSAMTKRLGLGLDHRQIGGLDDQPLHRQAIELAVGLGARPLHRRALAAVEDAELDAGGVGGAAHQAVERVDLAHQMALAEPADRRIAATSRRSCRSAG